MTGIAQRRPAVLIGLIGEGVTPSLTPPMHELEGARHGMSYVYRTVDLSRGQGTEEHVRSLFDAARRLGFTGLNITHPIKQTAIGLLDELSENARRVGAVNTVVFEGDRTVGHNTDITGFAEAFADELDDVARDAVVLVGAGGAGSAVATALRGLGVGELIIVDQDAERADALARTVAARTSGGAIRAASLDDLPALLARVDGVVNATPLGMAAHPGTAFDVSLLHERLFVVDIVYRPVETALLAAARARGCRVMSGLGMAMHQAADAFEIFTQEPADRRAMLADLENLVAAEAAGALAPVATLRGEKQ
ncbi:shikimate dehydrogenase [Microbacterium thalassium]|uniref:Shikimate dehydrogenase (NADP(+)) n=1 Tax=Microbacterium thalassium TaxID=362649 RepID=A0A7X0KTZ8_9MICO|nr:shikimate dehydrogenase [Microbacterium thalassium]MBB6390604.1 shikimate dehydrogenase [Microbacterium thalassium]GLK25714.1 shikimate dehydrogenase (NADP(+)) [Microbacterium thalassium]